MVIIKKAPTDVGEAVEKSVPYTLMVGI